MGAGWDGEVVDRALEEGVATFTYKWEIRQLEIGIILDF